MTDEPSKDRRVKVYQLNGEGQWDDNGTGHVTLTAVPEENTFQMEVQCEDSGNVLLEHKVLREIDYARQGETIITWCQTDNPDLALSFQETAGCTDVWNRIVAIIGDNENGGGLRNNQVEPIQLPEPSEEKLEAVLNAITDTPASHREFLVSALLQEDYLKKLLIVFDEVEKAEKKEATMLCFNLFKNIVLLNEISIYEALFSDEIFKSMIAVFDHDPTIKEGNKMQHRNYLAKATFKQVINVKDPTLVKKIHENYRMIYFKDVVLLRFLDDGALNTLGSLIYYNNATIVSHITECPDLVRDLFVKINQAVTSIDRYEKKGGQGKGEDRGPALTDSEAKDPFLFLQELCNIVKQMQVPQRESFYSTLVDADVFEAVEDALWAASPQKYPWVWQASVDVLHNMLIHDSALLRTFLVCRIPSKRSLLTRLVTMVVSQEVTPGLVHQLMEILRMVLDPDAMQPSDKDVFLDHFYAANAAHIEVALVQKAAAGSPSALLPKYNALEMFSMCAKQHGYRAKQYIVGHKILQKAMEIVELGEMQLTLSVIRLIRTCLGAKESASGAKDLAYAKCVEKHRLLDPIIDLFVANGARYNLLNSNVIELVDLIHRENIRELIAYLMEEHKTKFDNISYVDTFRMMAIQHQNNSSQDPMDDAKDDMRKVQSNTTERLDEDCEYTYFEGGDDGEEEEKPPPAMDMDEEDGFMPRKTMEEDEGDGEDDLISSISRRKAGVGGKWGRSKKNALPKKIAVSRKSNSIQSSPGSESPRKKRRVDEMKVS